MKKCNIRNSQNLTKFQKFCRDMKSFLWLIFIAEMKFEFRIDEECSIKLVPSFLSSHFEFSQFMKLQMTILAN